METRHFWWQHSRVIWIWPGCCWSRVQTAPSGPHKDRTVEWRRRKWPYSGGTTRWPGSSGSFPVGMADLRERGGARGGRTSARDRKRGVWGYVLYVMIAPMFYRCMQCTRLENMDGVEGEKRENKKKRFFTHYCFSSTELMMPPSKSGHEICTLEYRMGLWKRSKFRI